MKEKNIVIREFADGRFVVCRKGQVVEVTCCSGRNFFSCFFAEGFKKRVNTTNCCGFVSGLFP